MSKARLVAQMLFARFTAEGALSAIPQKLGSAEDGPQLASARNKQELWEETSVFSGLAVHSVGYEHGKDEPGVIIYVTKGSESYFKRLPKMIDGVKISVTKIGLINVRPEQAQIGKNTHEPKIFERRNRIACGSSCATATGDPGTFGAIVKRASEDELFMLSNNHVLGGCNHLPPGMPIMSPSPDDASPGARDPVTIAKLDKIVPLRSGHYSHVDPCEEDVALGKITLPDFVSSWQGGIDGYDTPPTIAQPTTGMRVKKAGRTTGLTLGMVHSFVSEPVPIPCNSKHFKGTVWYKNIWYVVGIGSAFALPGDSGSLVVTEDGKNIVGLLFGSNKTGDYGMMFPMIHIAKKLQIEFVSGHGV